MQVVVAGPPSHISSLAANLRNLCIQMVDPWDIFYGVDCSTDLPESVYGATAEICCRAMDEQFGTLLDRKYQNCTEWYLTNLATLGVQEPVIVIVRSDDGRWQFDEGHHRLSWSLRNDIPLIPVAFDDTGADDESQMGYLVSRVNVEAYHHTVMEEFLVPPAAERLFEEPADSVLTAQKHRGEITFIPRPRQPRRRDCGGRHRAR